MKALLVSLLLIGAALLALAFAIPAAHAQDAAPAAAELAPPTPQPEATDTLVADLAAKYPLLVTALAVVGLLRLLVKPVMEFLRARAAATETKADDERLDRIERSWWLRALLFVLDWGASIKPIK
jgi:hypothetical protein